MECFETNKRRKEDGGNREWSRNKGNGGRENLGDRKATHKQTVQQRCDAQHTKGSLEDFKRCRGYSSWLQLIPI